jgi:hypothetical protein
LSNFSFFKKIFFYFFPKRTKKRKKKSLYVIGVTIFGGVRSFLNGHRHRRQYRDRLTIFFSRFFRFLFLWSRLFWGKVICPNPILSKLWYGFLILFVQ